MKTHLEYGMDGLDIEVPDTAIVLQPRFVPGLRDEAAAFREAVRHPMESVPMKERIRSADRVAVVIPDITRPFPSDRILPWLFRELSHVPPERVVIINGTGSHRPNTPEELASMMGAEILRRYRVVNHDARDPDTLAVAGETPDGPPLRLNREYVRADRRIILGFIEPHFMAGFSGGYKAVLPGVTGIETIMHYHRASVIADSRSSWGILEHNPTQDQIRAYGALVPVDFCINVALNSRRQVARFFCGEVLAAHDAGCRFVRDTAMVSCPHAFPLVVTTNGGYPLDQNLYQSVKGMSAAAQIVAQGGLIVCAARCNEGFPAHGNFRRLLFDHASPEILLKTIMTPGFSMHDQWEAQILAMILLKSRVALYSELRQEDMRRAHLQHVDDLQGFLDSELSRLGNMPIAVLPEGPMTIPFIDTSFQNGEEPEFS